MLAPNDTQVDLIVNKLTEEQFNELSAQNRLNENQLWIVAPEEQPYMVLGRPDSNGLTSSMEDHTFDPVVYPDNFTFIALEANSTVSMSSSSGPSVSLEYSTDNGSTWQTFTVDSTTITLSNVGDMVSFRATSTNTRFASSYMTLYNYWVLTGQLKVVGDFRTLYSKDGWASLSQASTYACVYMFRNCTALKDAHNLNMGFSSWNTNAAARIFEGCTGLKRGPYLKTTTTGSYSWSLEYFFNGCTSLEEITLDMEDSVSWSNSAFQNWVSSVPSGGTIYTQHSSPGTGSSYFPSGWTIKALDERPQEGNVVETTHELSSIVFNRLTRTIYDSLSSVDPDQIWVIQEDGLSGQPIVIEPRPTLLSEFTNDVGYLSAVSWSDIQNQPTIPTSTSQLTNDSGYITSAQVDYKISNAIDIWRDWFYEEVPYLLQPFTVRAVQANSSVQIYTYGSPPSNSFEYSTDNGSTWSAYTLGTSISMPNVDDTVMFRNASNSTQLATFWNACHRIKGSGRWDVEGNIDSLLNKNFDTTATTYGYYALGSLFEGDGNYCLRNANNLMLPNHALADSCYRGTFFNTHLEKGPRMMATTLAQNCYMGIFNTNGYLNEIKLDYTGNFDNNAFWGSSTSDDPWCYNVAASGTFYYNGSDTTSGRYAIPSGWTVTPF